MRIVKSLLVVIVALTLNGCILRYHQESHFNRKVKSSYPSETLVYSNYVLCSCAGEMGTIEPGRIDTLKPDSMFAIVDRAFANAGINIERRQGSNFCTKELILERPFRGSDFKNDQVLALTDTSIAESQMVPVIFIHNLISFTGSMYNGVTTDDGFNYKPYITLLVCVIKDGEIVYRDMITHNALTTRAPELDKAYQLPSAANVTQDGWDEHVRRVMKRYFKRMEGEALGRKDDYW